MIVSLPYVVRRKIAKLVSPADCYALRTLSLDWALTVSAAVRSVNVESFYPAKFPDRCQIYFTGRIKQVVLSLIRAFGRGMITLNFGRWQIEFIDISLFYVLRKHAKSLREFIAPLCGIQVDGVYRLHRLRVLQVSTLFDREVFQQTLARENNNNLASGRSLSVGDISGRRTNQPQMDYMTPSWWLHLAVGSPNLCQILKAPGSSSTEVIMHENFHDSSQAIKFFSWCHRAQLVELGLFGAGRGTLHQYPIDLGLWQPNDILPVSFRLVQVSSSISPAFYPSCLTECYLYYIKTVDIDTEFSFTKTLISELEGTVEPRWNCLPNFTELLVQNCPHLRALKIEYSVLNASDFQNISKLTKLTDLRLIRCDGFTKMASEELFEALANQLTSFHFLAFDSSWNMGIFLFTTIPFQVNSLDSFLNYAIINCAIKLRAIVTLTLEMNISTVSQLSQALSTLYPTLRHLAVHNAELTEEIDYEEAYYMPVSLIHLNLKTFKLVSDFFQSPESHVNLFFNQHSGQLPLDGLRPTCSITYLHLEQLFELEDFRFLYHLHALKYLLLCGMPKVTDKVLLRMISPICPLEAVFFSNIPGALQFLKRNKFNLRKILIIVDFVVNSEKDWSDIFSNNRSLEILHLQEIGQIDWNEYGDHSPLHYRPPSLTHVSLFDVYGLTLERLQRWITRLPLPSTQETAASRPFNGALEIPWLTINVDPQLCMMDRLPHQWEKQNCNLLIASGEKLYQQLVEQAKRRRIHLQVCEGLWLNANVDIKQVITE
jgi:hypothetical protein